MLMGKFTLMKINLTKSPFYLHIFLECLDYVLWKMLRSYTKDYSSPLPIKLGNALGEPIRLGLVTHPT